MSATTHRVSTASTTNATSYVSGSFTPAANELLMVFVIYTQGTAVDLVPTLTSTGITFTRVLVKDADNHGSGVAIFVSDSLVAATSRTVTFHTSNTSTGCVIEVAGVSGMTKTGATAIRQSAGYDKVVDGGSSTTPFVVLGFTTLTTNVVMVAGCDVGNNPSAMVAPSGFTQLNATGYATPITGGSYSKADSGITNTTITSGGAVTGRWQYAVVELDTSSSGQNVSATGLGTAQAFGTPTMVPGGVTTTMTGKATSQQFGTIKANIAFSVSGLGSAQAFGKVSLKFQVPSLGSAAAFGSPLGVGIQVPGLGSAAAFGAPSVSTSSGGQNVPVSGKASSQAFGTPTWAATITIPVTGLGSAQAFANPQGNQAFSVPGKASSQAFGSVTPLVGNVNVPVGGLGSGQVFGAPGVTTPGGETLLIHVVGAGRRSRIIR